MEKRCYRKLGLSDLDLVVRMEADFRSDFICKENAHMFLSNPMCLIFACIENNRVIGFAYGYELNRLNNIGNMLYIHEVGVLPSFQRQGIGREILTEIKSLCKLSGICRIFLFTQKTNTPACALYESLGGEPAHDDDVSYFFNNFD
jgi:ribosomal protein S18 acetylase RimI-like enzyme